MRWWLPGVGLVGGARCWVSEEATAWAGCWVWLSGGVVRGGSLPFFLGGFYPPPGGVVLVVRGCVSHPHWCVCVWGLAGHWCDGWGLWQVRGGGCVPPGASDCACGSHGGCGRLSGCGCLSGGSHGGAVVLAVAVAACGAVAFAVGVVA